MELLAFFGQPPEFVDTSKFLEEVTYQKIAIKLPTVEYLWAALNSKLWMPAFDDVKSEIVLGWAFDPKCVIPSRVACLKLSENI